jgi:hypothetical protein
MDSGAAFLAAAEEPGTGAGGGVGCTGGGMLSTGGGVGGTTVGGGVAVALGVMAGAGSGSSLLCCLQPESTAEKIASVDKTARIA